MTPLLGFAPDMEATTPGVITDCDHFIPYLTGMEAAPTPVTPVDVPVLADDCRGAVVATLLDGTRRIFAGTEEKLYEVAGGTWIDRSRVGDYNGGVDTRWSFTQFGSTSIAANRADVMQRSVGAGFVDIAGAPSAEIVFSVGAFVMALNLNDGGEKPNGWHCCAAFDDTDWTESIATQSASGQLVATPGALTAGLRLGEYAVAYKAKSMYLGQYVGSPVVWDWILVPGGEAGCVGKEALCDIDGLHFFVGQDNFWVFDGTRPQPVGNEKVRQWFFDQLDPQSSYKTKCVFDRQQNRVTIAYASRGSEVCDSALVYHVKSGQWGRDDRTVQALLNYVSGGATFDTWDSYGATYDSLPQVSYDSQYWLSGGSAMSFFDPSNQLQSLTGEPAASSFTTGDAGDDSQVSSLTEIRLRYAAGAAPTTATAFGLYKMNSGDSYTNGPSGAVNDGKFDLRQSARWHKARFDFTGTVKVTGIKPAIKATGKR